MAGGKVRPRFQRLTVDGSTFNFLAMFFGPWDSIHRLRVMLSPSNSFDAKCFLKIMEYFALTKTLRPWFGRCQQNEITVNTVDTGLAGAGTLKLLFSDNRFVIQDVQGLHPAKVPGLEWAAIDNTTFTTRSVQAAAQFRQHAEGKAKKIFEKLMLRTMVVPSGGSLSPKGLELMPFQRLKGVPHILKSNRSYLAHQPGLGKTAQAIAAVNAKPGRALVIAPSFLRTTWAREITKWSTRDFPSITQIPAATSAAQINWAADFVICSDSMLMKDWVVEKLREQNFRFIFIDEGHRFKTPDAQRTLALFGGRLGYKHFPGLIYSAEHVCVLSGTPMLNRPIELWPVLFAMAPELIDFMPYNDFGFRYGGARQDERGRWIFPGSSREAELRDRIMGRFMQRITKRDVLDQLPDKIREVLVVDGSQVYRKPEVAKLDQELMRRFESGGYEKPRHLGEYAEVRHANGLAKVGWAAEFVSSILREDDTEQVIVFAHHRDVVAKLARHKLVAPYYPMVINGGVDVKIRTLIEDTFQRGMKRLIIGNIDAMNLGLTLTKATRVVFVEYAWTPALNEQAEDRAHRIGQHDSVLCQYLVLPGSIDEMILNSILTKEKRIGRVIG